MNAVKMKPSRVARTAGTSGTLGTVTPAPAVEDEYSPRPGSSVLRPEPRGQ